MKLFSSKLLLLRTIAAVNEAILFYMVFLLVNVIFQGGRVSLIFFILTSLCGLFVNLLPYNSSDKHKQRQVFGAIGLVLGIVAVMIASIQSFNLLALPVVFVFIIYLYYRINISYLASILYIYTAKSFYQSAAILFAINAALVFWSKVFSGVSEELMRYSILYLILAFYLLSEIKNQRYVSKNENSRKPAFDLAATGSIIIITVIMSIPKVFTTVAAPFAAVIKWAYGWIAKAILFLIQPLAMLMGYLYDLLGGPGEVQQQPGGGGVMDINDKLKQALHTETPPFVQFIGKALAFLIIMMICAFAVYLLFKFINRLTNKQEEEDFVEEKEFVIKGNEPRPLRLISKLTGAIRKAAGGIAFMLTADNKDKLRHDYKSFVDKLYSKKIISSYNYTAQDILSLLLAKVPDHTEELTNVTMIYEEVRYGTRYPKDNELKSFRKNLAEVSKNLLQMQ